AQWGCLLTQSEGYITYEYLLLPPFSLGHNYHDTMNLFDLSEDVAVVIGATGILGGALAEGLAAAGAKVAVLGRNAERGAARVKSIHNASSKSQAAFFQADAANRDSLQAAHQSILRTLGLPTVLVNAAGGNDPKVTV